MMKVLFWMALRQTAGFVESLLRLVGLDWTVPGFSTLSRRQKTLAVNIPYRGSQGPLHLLVPSRALLRKTLPGNGQHLRHAQLPQRYCRSRRSCQRSTPQKCKTMETDHGGCHRAQ
jgi:hypothetical protein